MHILIIWERESNSRALL